MTTTFYSFHESEGAPILEWDHDKIVGDKRELCPVNSGHPGIGRTRANSLHVILPNPSVLDVMSTWYSEYVLSERAVDVFASEQLSGYVLNDAAVSGIKQNRGALSRLPPLWELKIVGWGGQARPESGLDLRYRCPACGYTCYGSLRDPSAIIDVTQWDGSDFFLVWPLPRFVFVTERVRQVVAKHKLTGVDIRPMHGVRTSGGGVSPGRLWYYMDKERARQLGGPLGIE